MSNSSKIYYGSVNLVEREEMVFRVSFKDGLVLHGYEDSEIVIPSGKELTVRANTRGIVESIMCEGLNWSDLPRYAKAYLESRVMAKLFLGGNNLVSE